MNRKNRFLSGGVALGLLASFTLALTVFEPLLSHAQPKSKQAQTRESQALPLGKANLAETRQTTQIAPGVTRTLITRGEQSTEDMYTVDVAFRATREEAQVIADKLAGQGFEPALLIISKRAQDDPVDGPLGYLVRVGAFSSEAEAIQLRDRLVVVGYTGLRVIYSGEDGAKTTGPWVINVLELDPAAFQGKVSVVLGTGIVPENERLTQISSKTGALTAINGGYFVIGAADGTPGDLAGISIIDGKLVSEAVNGRTSLILPSHSGKNARIAALTTELMVSATDGATREIDGLNRKPGLIRGCGGVGGDLPTELPKHDFTCKDDSELIRFTQAFGQVTEPGDGVEVVLDASGRVVEFRLQRGGQIPATGSVLAGTGDAAEWLQTNAKPDTRLRLQTRLFADHKKLPLRKNLAVVNGGPRLLRDGKLDIPAFAEGFQQPENPEFYYRFGVRRNPRTLAGITASGKILLVAVDGRRPGYSVGASFIESARILRSLGAVDAVNLDGGGSTTLTIDQQLVNRPSDATGERPIGDAIVIQP